MLINFKSQINRINRNAQMKDNVIYKRLEIHYFLRDPDFSVLISEKVG